MNLHITVLYLLWDKFDMLFGKMLKGNLHHTIMKLCFFFSWLITASIDFCLIVSLSFIFVIPCQYCSKNCAVGAGWLVLLFNRLEMKGV